MTNAPHPWPGFLPPQSWRGADALYIARKLGLASGLRLVLDPGDATSLPAASAKVLDLSGNGYDFYRGTSTGGDAAEPSINGTAGGRSSAEYLGFDGGDYLLYDTTNETWMDNLHKDNAKYTFLGWFLAGSIGTAMGLFGLNGQALSRTGVSLTLLANGHMQVVTARGDGTTAYSQSSNAFGGAAMSSGVWELLGISIDEGAGTIDFITAGGVTASSTGISFSSPSASNASYTMQIGARGNNNGLLVSSSRLGPVWMWEGVALTAAQMQAVRQASRGRFGV